MIQPRLSAILGCAVLALTGGCSADGPEQQRLMQIVDTAKFTDDPAIGMSKHWQRVEFAYLSHGHGPSEGQVAACLFIVSRHTKRRHRRGEVWLDGGRLKIPFTSQPVPSLAKRSRHPTWQDNCSDPLAVDGAPVTYQRFNAFLNSERRIFDELAESKGFAVARWTPYRAPDW